MHLSPSIVNNKKRKGIEKVIVSLIFSLCVCTQLLTDLDCSRFTLTRKLGKNATSTKPRPTIYTFVDYDSRTSFWEDQLKLWSDRWQGAGWNTMILTPTDVTKNPY